jgi:hypothetical protein
VWRGLQEELRPRGVVDEIVDVLLGGFLHPSVAAAAVGHAAGPNLLPIDRGQQLHVAHGDPLAVPGLLDGGGERGGCQLQEVGDRPQVQIGREGPDLVTIEHSDGGLV